MLWPMLLALAPAWIVWVVGAVLLAPTAIGALGLAWLRVTDRVPARRRPPRPWTRGPRGAVLIGDLVTTPGAPVSAILSIRDGVTWWADWQRVALTAQATPRLAARYVRVFGMRSLGVAYQPGIGVVEVLVREPRDARNSSTASAD